MIVLRHRLSDKMLEMAAETQQTGCMMDAYNYPNWYSGMMFRGAGQWLTFAAFFRSLGL